MTPKSTASNGIRSLNQVERVFVLLANVALAWTIFYLATGQMVPSGSGSSIWFLAATSFWFLSLLGTPFFTPPKDAFTTAIAIVLLLLPIDLSLAPQFGTLLDALKWTGIGLSILVATLALIAIFRHDRTYGQLCYHLSRHLGRGEIQFTIVVVVATLGFLQASPLWMYGTLIFWTIMVTVQPVEVLLRAAVFLKESLFGVDTPSTSRTGSILRIDDPNIVRVALSGDINDWNMKNLHVAHLPDGRKRSVLPLFRQVQDQDVVGTGIVCDLDEAALANSVPSGVYLPAAQTDEKLDEVTAALGGADADAEIVGIVVENSSISSVKFQVVGGASLKEGSVVFTQLGDHRVYYQVLDAVTDEESFQQNPYGAHIATAAQLGTFDDREGFQKYAWLPPMNHPVFSMAEGASLGNQEVQKGDFLLGEVPTTSFGIPMCLKDLVEYHTAILGMTGTAKTELAFDVIREAITQGVKVFCVDFTGEYKSRLVDLAPKEIGLSEEHGSQIEQLLFAIDTTAYGAPDEKRAFQQFIDGVKPDIENQIDSFIRREDARLGVFELAEIANTKATLRITELYLSAIMNWAKQNRKAQQILIVLEEAHTIIPEAFGAGFDANTKWVVERIGQIALQGRKYGVGLMIISQRTALVSKTILSQCHTYFVHALADKTSLDYLGSILPTEYVRSIPNLKFLEFIAHGKAIRSERALLGKRPFDQEKADASAALDAKL